jgi:(p)ppGpp synthase/HD superfamily hydrolase
VNGPGDLPAAYDFAARAHSGQFRAGVGQVPYINHPCAVAALVARAGGSQAAIIAAVLHDTVEDTPVTLTEIGDGFGPAVATLVAALTDTPEMEAMPDPERKAVQAAKIANAPPAARLVKLADQACNLRDLCGVFANWPRDRRKAYLVGATAIAHNCAGLSPMLDAAFADAALALATMIKQEDTGQ